MNAIMNMKEHITRRIASRIVFEIKFIINDKISEDILIDLSNYIWTCNTTLNLFVHYNGYVSFDDF